MESQQGKKKDKASVEYKPFNYWEERLTKDFSLGGVGMLGLGQIYNSWLYRIKVLAVNRAIRAMNIKIQGQSVLDVGCGTGFWLSYWKRKGAAKLTGIDITEIAINRLRQRFPDIALYQDNIARPGLNIPDTFDVISAFDILFHITDDQEWVTALENIVKHLKRGGWLLITDLFLHDRDFRGYHQVSRRLAEYEAQLKKLGVKVLGRFPVFVFAHPPLDASGRWRRILEKIWSLQTTALRNAKRLRLEWLVAHALGGCMFLLELIATHLCQEGPTMELMVCRKEENS